MNAKNNNMRLVPYSQGIGRYEQIEVIRFSLVNEFNEQLEEKLSTGWRLVQEIRIMGYSNDYFYAVVAKPRK